MIFKIKHFIGYLVFLVLFYFGLRFFRSYFFAILLFFFLIFPFISILISRYAARSLTYEIISPSSLYKDGQFKIKLIAKNKTIFPIPRHKVYFTIQNLFYENSETQTASFGVGAKSEDAIIIPLVARYSGIIRVNIQKAVVLDYLGFISFTNKKLTVNTDTIIFPKSLNVPVDTKMAGGIGYLELSETETKGSDATTPIDVRPFIPGDKLNTIHWKLSIKLDELMVKEFGSLSDHDTNIVIDLYQKNGTANRSFDDMFDMLHTIGLHLIEEKRPFCVYFIPAKGLELTSMEIYKNDDLLLLYQRLFYATKQNLPDASYEQYVKLIEMGGDFIYIHAKNNQFTVHGETVIENDNVEALVIKMNG